MHHKDIKAKQMDTRYKKDNKKTHMHTQMSKHGNPQSLTLIGVQTSEKMSKRHFIKQLACIPKSRM